jgi:predicted ester cyclase
MKHLAVLTILLLLPTPATAEEEVDPPSTAAVGGASTPQEERNVALVMRLYDEVWHGDDYRVADEILAEHYIRHDGSEPVQGPGDAVLQSERARQVKAMFPDLRFEPEVVLADGNLVAVRWTSSAIPAGLPALLGRLVGKGGPIMASGVNIYRVEAGRVVEIWNNRDDLTIQREMGVFRLYTVAGFMIGVLVTLLCSWGVARWRSTRT